MQDLIKEGVIALALLSGTQVEGSANDQLHQSDARVESSLALMYGDEDLSKSSLFTGGYINYGMWPSETPLARHITLQERLESEQRLYQYLFNAAEIREWDTVLEIGCGRGCGAAQLLSQRQPEAIVGLDASTAQIQRAIAEHAELSKIAFSVGSAEDMPVLSNSFSKVISVEAAQHFLSIPSFVSEAHRALSPGGVLAIASMFGTNSAAHARVAPHLQTVDKGIDHVRSIWGLIDHLRNTGFCQIEVESIGETVWPGWNAWVVQTEHSDSWDRNWLRAYKDGHIDYYVITATKAPEALS